MAEISDEQVEAARKIIAAGIKVFPGPNGRTGVAIPDSVVRSALEAALLPRPVEAGVPTHRHLKSGHLVRVIGTGRMQADWWRVWIGPARDTFVTADMHEVVIYEHGCNLWARPVEEFNDGRFQALPTSPATGAEG